MARGGDKLETWLSRGLTNSLLQPEPSSHQTYLRDAGRVPQEASLCADEMGIHIRGG